MKNKEHNLGYIQYANGNIESIEYIAERNDVYVRVFVKSGEYVAYRNGSNVWRHFVCYVPIPSITGSFKIDDMSEWFVADGVINISVISDIE